MGLNRFSTVGQSEYTEQHVPLPFDTISKLGEQIKLEHDTADAAASAAKTDIQGGLATQEHAKALNAKKNALLKAAQERAEREGNYGRLTQDIKEIASTVQNDPLYQGIQRDIAMTKLVNQQRMDPNHPYVIQNYSDEKGNVKQLGIDQPFDESYYNVVAPGDRNAERKPLYAQIKPVISRIYDQPVTKTWIDEMGRENTQTLQEGVEAEGLRRAQVKEVMANYIRQDPNALNTQSYMYDKARLKKQGLDWTPEQELDATANAFLGEYYNEKEIQKLGADKVTSPLKDAGDGSGGGSGKVKAPIPNAYTGLLTTDTVVDEHLDGLFRPNEDGTHTVPLQGSIMNFAKVSNATPEEDKVITWGQQVYNLKKKMGYVNDPVTVVANLEKKDAAGNYYSPNNLDIYRKDNKTGAVTLVGTVEDLANKAVKDTPQYKFLKESASQEGLDIDSPEFQQTYKKGLGKFTEETIDELGKILEIGGEAKFVVNEGKNKMNVDNKPFLSGKAIMTESELNLAFEQVGKGNINSIFDGDWGDVYMEPDGAGYGAIKPAGSVTKDGKTEQLYSIDIKKEIPVSRAVNKTYNKNVYTESYTANANSLDQSYDEFANNQLSKQDLSVYNAMYTKDKKAFDENLNQLLEYNKGIYTPKLTKILADINAEKDPNKKKQAMIQFSLKLKNGEVEEMINGIDNFQNSTQPATVGKSQGGWSQTPATPLKK